MVFIVLIPFFSFTEVARVIGEDELVSIILKRETSTEKTVRRNRHGKKDK